MTTTQEIYSIFTKVFSDIEKNPSKITNTDVLYCGKTDERAFTVENIENLACNHLFDDHPELFNITELEGCIIRHYFQVGVQTFDFVKDLRQKYPHFFKQSESKQYLDSINSRRKLYKLEPISL